MADRVRSCDGHSPDFSDRRSVLSEIPAINAARYCGMPDFFSAAATLFRFGLVMRSRIASGQWPVNVQIQ